MKKSERLGLVLTPNEKQTLSHLAAQRGGLSKSALIRCLIHEAVQTTELSKVAQNEAPNVQSIFSLLEAEEIVALEKFAKQEHRNLHQQAAVIIRRELKHLKLI